MQRALFGLIVTPRGRGAYVKFLDGTIRPGNAPFGGMIRQLQKQGQTTETKSHYRIDLAILAHNVLASLDNPNVPCVGVRGNIVLTEIGRASCRERV